MKLDPISRIQGPGLLSPLAGKIVTTRGVVTGRTGRGFFIQDHDGKIDDEVSHGIFVYERRGKPPIGSLVEVSGKVVDYTPGENVRPTTQIEERETRVLLERGASIEPVWLDAAVMLLDPERLRFFLNNLEGMLVGLPADSVFVAPSNLFGDYVVLPPGTSLVRTQQGGVLINPLDPECWLPGFRMRNYGDAPQVNVGAQLLDAVTGPLNFRVGSYQVAVEGSIRVQSEHIKRRSTELRGQASKVTILTLNCFNLDAKVESPELVRNPSRDVDDDLGSGRFDALARAIVTAANCPDVVALQEIQDNDGAELTDVVSAEFTLETLIQAVRRAGGPLYQWADIAPKSGADGGQPGGNIRNAFLYQPQRVSLVPGSLKRIGDESDIYEDSRKPLVARFQVNGHPGQIEIINVHLASKRHQYGHFAPQQPGFDPRLALRVQQAQFIGKHTARLRSQSIDYYITGDFNDFEFSPTLQALTEDHSTNLLETVPSPLRFDYNHRGLSQALMHGVVANRQLQGRTAEYEILHANALLGAHPGQTGSKPSDHAYVIARLGLA
ncbi:MAG: putative extracellular nuclease [Glaciecola sp.]